MSSSVTFTIEYFALFRSLAKKSEETLTFDTTSLPEIYEQLRGRYGFPLGRESVHVAVNDAYVPWDAQPQPGDRVVFIPPVSGVDVFRLTSDPIDAPALRRALENPACGACVCFEGLIRNHNEGRAVHRLEYEAYEPLALKEGEAILRRARELFRVEEARCVHRTGPLEIGDMAVWVGVSSAHRGEAFAACSYIIDAVKKTVPIWKREHYADGTEEWVNCATCAPGTEKKEESGRPG